jgi:hypothetical protein
LRGTSREIVDTDRPSSAAIAVSVSLRASPREIVSRSSIDNRNAGRGRTGRGRTPPDCRTQFAAVVLDTRAAAAACLNVAPLARAVKNTARTSAGFGFLPIHASTIESRGQDHAPILR